MKWDVMITSSTNLSQIVKNKQAPSCHLNQKRIGLCCKLKQNVRKPKDKQQKTKVGITGKANSKQHKQTKIQRLLKEIYAERLRSMQGPKRIDRKANQVLFEKWNWTKLTFNQDVILV